MDNAAKALIFAGGILIGILVISVSLYIIASARGTAKISNEKIQANAVESFNRFYVAYGDGNGTTISAIDAVNIYRKASDDKTKNYITHSMEISTGDFPNDIIEFSNSIDGINLSNNENDYASTLNQDYRYSYTKDFDGYIYKIKIEQLSNN